MSFFTTLFAAVALQGVPSDVPKDHWAYGAVNELFEQGLLKGYPTGKPLDFHSIKWEWKTVDEAKKRFRAAGMLVGYPEGLWSYRPDSNYEQAVFLHATWTNLLATKDPSETWLREIPNLATYICMLQTELTKLGADSKQMIADLENFRQKHENPFRG